MTIIFAEQFQTPEKGKGFFSIPAISANSFCQEMTCNAKITKLSNTSPVAHPEKATGNQKQHVPVESCFNELDAAA